jgi:hypothetical protein
MRAGITLVLLATAIGAAGCNASSGPTAATGDFGQQVIDATKKACDFVPIVDTLGSLIPTLVTPDKIADAVCKAVTTPPPGQAAPPPRVPGKTITTVVNGVPVKGHFEKPPQSG